jgi:hypothetical protein
MFNIIEPLLVVAIVRKMKIQNVLQNEYEVPYPLLNQRVNDVRLEGHDIVFYGIVPFANEFQNTAPCVVIHEQDFEVQGCGTKFVPLRVDKEIIYTVLKFKLAILPPIERGFGVFRGNVLTPPTEKRFDVMHDDAKVE